MCQSNNNYIEENQDYTRNSKMIKVYGDDIVLKLLFFFIR